MPKAFKFVDYIGPGAGQLLTRNYRTIWATVGTDGAATRYLTPIPTLQFIQYSLVGTLPQALQSIGVAGGESGITADRVWYYRSLDLRFNISKNVTAIAVPTVYYRLLVITERTENQNLDEFNNTYDGGLNIPILFKDWKVHYDKVFAVNTGLTQYVGAGLSAMSGNYSTGKNFKFKIPFKYRASLPFDFTGEAVDAWQPPLNTFILVMCDNDNVVTVSNVFCRQIFTVKP